MRGSAKLLIEYICHLLYSIFNAVEAPEEIRERCGVLPVVKLLSVEIGVFTGVASVKIKSLH